MDFKETVVNEICKLYPDAIASTSLPPNARLGGGNSAANTARKTPKALAEVHVRQLLRFDGAEFVRKCYTEILRREPDPSGLQNTLQAIECGIRSKLDVIEILRNSPEGNRMRVQLRGLGAAKLQDRLYAFASLDRHRKKKTSKHARKPTSDSSHPTNTTCSVWELLDLEDERFVEACYRQILKRPPDELGFNNFVQMLRSGRIDQIKVIESIVASQEAKQAKVRVRGLAKARWEKRLSRVPIVGSLVDIHATARTVRRLKSRVKRLEASSMLNDASTEISKDAFSAFYLAFEDRFRGSREAIRKRQQVYLPTLDSLRKQIGNFPVLDVACGRGEWLELLRENQFEAIGVDINDSSLEVCRKLNLKVECMDVFQFLRRIRSESYLAVSAFHLIEHIPMTQLLFLIEEVKRVLVPGGMVIFETPNPTNLIVGSHTFYLDPTHRNPLPPGLMQFALEHGGFRNVSALALHAVEGREPMSGFHGAETLNELLYGPQDYAVMGVK